MKIEPKVAWPKNSPWNDELLRLLRLGSPVPIEGIHAAVDDKDHRKVFDPTSSHPLKKENHVIFQYGVVLRRPDGRVAVFERARRELGQERITPGRSILLSASSPDSPADAVPAIVRNKLCVGRRRRMGGFQSLGMIWDHLLPDHRGRARPTYLFDLYTHEIPDDIPVHGRFHDSPDSLVEWISPEDLSKHLSHSGFIDQILARRFSGEASTALDEGEDGVIFSPSSRLSTSGQVPSRFTAAEYSHGHGVFISHASEDSFSAYALYRFLIDESSRSILARLDLEDLRDGERVSKIGTMIEECDGVVLVVTPSLLEKSERLRSDSEKKDWVRWEIEYARELGKPILGFKLGTLGRPHYLPEDLVCNNKAVYTDWLDEVRELVERVQAKFGRTVF